jgi:ligand-binding SRPBCC domain-containing protein
MEIKEKLTKIIKGIISSPELLGKIHTNPDGLILITTGWSILDQPIYTEINVVKEIKKVPGLKYRVYHDEYGGYDPRKNYVAVTSEVGDLVSIYLKADGFAGMELSEFLQKSGITES